MSILKWSGRALCVAMLAAPLAACDFLNPIVEDPNAVPAASADQLLVGVQVSHYVMEEGQSSRLASVWTQQMDGTDRQFITLAEYVLTEQDAGDIMDVMYIGGGLVDIRKGIAAAMVDGRRAYAGIFKVLEAHIMGMTAAEYGDLPYSEAVNPEITQPALDTQAEINTAVLAKLDEAIADLQSGAGAGPGGADFAYGGDFTKWIAAAHTLKARFNLHWVEAEGNSRYTAARDEALQGILAASGDWLADHSTSFTETFFWRQFQRDRSGYIQAGKFMTDLMNTNADPRMRYLYSFGDPAAGLGDTVIGSDVGTGVPTDPETQASELACGPVRTEGCLGFGYGSAEFDFPILTCAENYFIIAEAEYFVGTEANAIAALDNALQCAEDLWVTRYGIATMDLQTLMDRNDGMSGPTLLQEIMEQKYVHQFLSRDTWNDYKRVCTPGITPFAGGTVPGRFYYSNNERESNENVPPPAQQPVRNANDPNPC
jgi:hypothetical protein